jgi:hypothetical protein
MIKIIFQITYVFLCYRKRWDKSKKKVDRLWHWFRSRPLGFDFHPARFPQGSWGESRWTERGCEQLGMYPVVRRGDVS